MSKTQFPSSLDGEVGSVGDVCRPTDIWVILATVLGHLGAAFAAPKRDILNNKLGRFPAEFVAARVDILRERLLGAFAAAFAATQNQVF